MSLQRHDWAMTTLEPEIQGSVDRQGTVGHGKVLCIMSAKGKLYVRV
jgi:hypothetical protein